MTLQSQASNPMLPLHHGLTLAGRCHGDQSTAGVDRLQRRGDWAAGFADLLESYFSERLAVEQGGGIHAVDGGEVLVW